MRCANRGPPATTHHDPRSHRVTDDEAMDLALAQARLAQQAGEVPVGAVVLRDGVVVGVGRNAPIGSHDPTAHAEIVAMRAAARALGNYRLDGCEVFVTLEPCAMCSGAMLHARVARVVYGATDPKTGAAGSVLNLFGQAQLNHQTEVQAGARAEACAALLRDFFQRRRAEGRAKAPLRDDALRTPDARFLALADEARDYLNDLPDLGGLRMHVRDTGGAGAVPGPVFLCLHGHDTWSYLYRALLAASVDAGVRVVAPDLIGFGRSDKPKKTAQHTLAWHQQLLQQLVERLDLREVVLVVQGTGGLLGAALQPADPGRYRGIVVVDPALAHAALLRPDAAQALPAPWTPAVQADLQALLRAPVGATTDAHAAAWAAPFPDRGHRSAQQAMAAWPLAPQWPQWPVARITAPGPQALAGQLLTVFQQPTG